MEEEGKAILGLLAAISLVFFIFISPLIAFILIAALVVVLIYYLFAKKRYAAAQKGYKIPILLIIVTAVLLWSVYQFMMVPTIKYCEKAEDCRNGYVGCGFDPVNKEYVKEWKFLHEAWFLVTRSCIATGDTAACENNVCVAVKGDPKTQTNKILCSVTLCEDDNDCIDGVCEGLDASCNIRLGQCNPGN